MNRPAISLFSTLCVALLAGCATTPADHSATIASIRKVTVVCCDYKDEVNVMAETKAAMTLGFAGAVSGGMLGAVGASALTGGVGLYRTNSFYEAAAEKPLAPHQPFVNAIVAALAKRGYQSQVAFPSFYDGYQGKYLIDAQEVKGDAILELRHMTNIANTDDRFFPSVGVWYRLLTHPGRTELASGLVGSSDSGVTVMFGDKRPFSAPVVSFVARNAGGGASLNQTGTVFDLPADRVVVGDTATLNTKAKKMYLDVIATIGDAADRVVATALKRP
jgi:hypothetical protein